MTEFVPSGYISLREALNRLGQELFPADWTGEEQKARSGLPPHRTGDPSDPSYQNEYRARARYVATIHEAHVRLEAGRFEATVADPWSGKLHRVFPSLWRRANADRMIVKGEAPIPGSPNTGSLLIKRFADPSVTSKRMPAAIILEAIEALKEKTAAGPLTRPQQAKFVRKNYPNYRVTERQMSEIFRAVRVEPGRPRKSNKKV